MPPTLPIVLQDEHFAAIAKPVSLLMHRSRMAREQGTVMDRLRDTFQRPIFGVHRLDRGTSGILMVAFDAETARTLSLAFTHRHVRKLYLALVRGWINAPLTIIDPLRDQNRPGKPLLEAASDVYPLARVELPFPMSGFPTARYSLVGVEPHTGRWHQIRRHLVHLSHPVIGDHTHGDNRHNRLFIREFGVRRLLLHAHRIRFPHPQKGHQMELSVPLPGGFAHLACQFHWPLEVPFTPDKPRRRILSPMAESAP